VASKLDIPILGTKRRVPLALYGPVVLIALAVVGYFVFMNNWYDYFWPRRWGTVEKGRIYRSNEIHPRVVRKVLSSKGIEVVVNMEGEEPDSPHQQAELAACDELGIVFNRFPMKGNGVPGDKALADALDKYAAALAVIVGARRNEKVVLIQCGAGRHRTGGMTATYRMLIEGDSGPGAYRELRSYGWKPWKHQILADWINANLGAIAERLVAMGVIDAVPDPLPYLGPEGAEPIRKDPNAVHARAID